MKKKSNLFDMESLICMKSMLNCYKLENIPQDLHLLSAWMKTIIWSVNSRSNCLEFVLSIYFKWKWLYFSICWYNVWTTVCFIEIITENTFNILSIPSTYHGLNWQMNVTLITDMTQMHFFFIITNG